MGRVYDIDQEAIEALGLPEGENEPMSMEEMQALAEEEYPDEPERDEEEE